MSNLLLVNDALRLINVLPEGQDASADQGEIALRVFAELVNEWQDDGILIAWEPSTSLADDCSLTGTELNASKYALAVKLAPLFGRDPPIGVVAQAAASVNRLIRQQLWRSIDPAKSMLPIEEGHRQDWDIEG